MTTRSASARAAVVLAAAGALLVSGCGGSDVNPRTVNADTPAPTPAAASVEQTPTRAPAPTQATAELPPGDPGPDAPAVPDPGRPEHGRNHEEPALTVVPREAMLDAQTVSAVLGGGDWREAGAPAMACLSDASRVGERSTSYRAADAEVLQTVGTHTSLEAADRAVQSLARRLRGCGWEPLPDPRLGSASTAASTPTANGNGMRTVVVIAAEGVTVTLVGSDGATSDRARWSSLVDLALGDSCAAAADGCH